MASHKEDITGSGATHTIVPIVRPARRSDVYYKYNVPLDKYELFWVKGSGYHQSFGFYTQGQMQQIIELIQFIDRKAEEVRAQHSNQGIHVDPALGILLRFQALNDQLTRLGLGLGVVMA